jgi:hypothetical protein
MKDFIELKLLRELIATPHPLMRVHELARVEVQSDSYPIIGLSIGSEAPEAPTLGIFGGVHGLEKVGTHVALAFLKSILKQLEWDNDLRMTMENSRIVSIPLINPTGMSRNRRSNSNGVDLMRNSPTNCLPGVKTTPFVSGHRYGPWLPWYRGKQDSPMEIESQALINFVQSQTFSSRCSISIDIHSGFGMKDRLWFPYSKTSNPFPGFGQVQKIKDLLDSTLPHHIYIVEPQSDSYTIQGDLWDYLYDLHQEGPAKEGKLYIPWTLEMGSWSWVKKNPRQLLSAAGLFNPVKAHRYDRIMRRHLLLLEFLFRATRNQGAWAY